MNFVRTALPLTTAALLAACSGGQPAGDDVEPSPTPSPAEPSPEPTETVSILRPDIEGAETVEEQPLEPLLVTVRFDEGGEELDADAVAKLETVLKSEQLATGAPIILSSHTDSAGSDAANEKASEERGLAVARWFIDQGVADDRITVIAFGEQNPIAPNALPDGKPNEEGRARNRRVEISIVPLEVGEQASEDGAGGS